MSPDENKHLESFIFGKLSHNNYLIGYRSIFSESSEFQTTYSLKIINSFRNDPSRLNVSLFYESILIKKRLGGLLSLYQRNLKLVNFYTESELIKEVIR